VDFAETPVTAGIPAAAFIDGDDGLTDIQAHHKNSMRAATAASTLHSLRREEEEGPMPRSEKSIAIPTGMIIAALYTVLLIGFSRESYMRRDAASRAAIGHWPFRQMADRACQVGQLDCEALPADVGERRDCPVSMGAFSRRGGGVVPPLTTEDLQQALGAQP